MYHKNNNTINRYGMIALINNALEPAFAAKIKKKLPL